MAKEIEREAAKCDPSYRPLTYAEIAEECFRVRMEGNRESTRREARRIYDRLIDAFGYLGPDDVTDPLWLEQLEVWKQELKRKTFANYRKYATQIDNYAFRKGYKRFRCDFPVKDPSPREGLVLSHLDFRRLLRGTRTRLKTRGRNGDREVGKVVCFNQDAYDFLILARGHGNRRSELWKLEWDRVDFEKRSIRLGEDNVKNARRRHYPMTVSGYRILKRRWENRTSDQWVFPGRDGKGPTDMKKAMQRLAKRTGVPFKPHDLRHTFFTEKVVREGQNLTHTSLYGGVRSETLQKRYLHARVDDLRHLVEGRGGKSGARLKEILGKLSEEELALLREAMRPKAGAEESP